MPSHKSITPLSPRYGESGAALGTASIPRCSRRAPKVTVFCAFCAASKKRAPSLVGKGLTFCNQRERRQFFQLDPVERAQRVTAAGVARARG